jgi:cell wall-associated NlpC family hydrolase
LVPDRRLTPARPDLAAAHLKGRVAAARFVDGERMVVAAPVVALRPKPDLQAGIDTELLGGETVMVYERKDGFAWVQAERDEYVGYLDDRALLPSRAAATHHVSALRTFGYAKASIKTPSPVVLHHGALVTVIASEGDFAVTDDGRFIIAHHIRPVGDRVEDWVGVAEMFLHAPYLWGGRSGLGLDCSALLQTALVAGGHAAPRDSDMLEAWFSKRLPITAELSGLKRGDAIFWKGHCGVMLDATRLLHANGHHMRVAVEPLAEAAARILARSYGPITSIARLAG